MGGKAPSYTVATRIFGSKLAGKRSLEGEVPHMGESAHLWGVSPWFFGHFCLGMPVGEGEAVWGGRRGPSAGTSRARRLAWGSPRRGVP